MATGTNIQNGILGGLASAGNWLKGAVNTVGNDIKNSGAVQNTSPGLAAQNAINQAKTGAAKVTATTPTPTPKPLALGIKAIAPTTVPSPKTLPKNQIATPVAPKVQASTEQINTNTPQQNNPNVTQVPNQTQQQLEDQYNNKTSTFNTALGGLAGAQMANNAITANTQKQVDDTAANIAQLRSNAVGTEQAYNTGMIAPRAQGLAQNTAQTEAGQETALQGQLSNELTAGGQELTGQAQTQSAQQAAGSLAQPNGNIINVDPTTGLPVAGGSLAGLAQTAGTVAGIQSGAASQAAASGNISAQNATALGTAATGANAKSIGDFTNQVNTTQKSVVTLDNLANQIVPNMTSTGFNPTSSPIGNQTFQQYFTEKNPAAQQGITEGLTEVKNQISNVISSATGLTPTGVTSALAGVDLTTLNPQQLHDFLGYINQYAQSNVDAANKSISTLQNGGTINSNVGPLPAPTANSTGQAAAGTGATLAENLIGKIVSEAGNAVAGAVGGIASSILK